MMPNSIEAPFLLLAFCFLHSLEIREWLPAEAHPLQVIGTSFSGNAGTNGGALAMQSVTNASFSDISAVSNIAGCGGGMFIDRAASIQVHQLQFSMNLTCAVQKSVHAYWHLQLLSVAQAGNLRLIPVVIFDICLRPVSLLSMLSTLL